MYQTVNESDFRDAFRAYDRADSFSHEGLGLLFDFLEEMAADTGDKYELDVIALCCDFRELTTAELLDEYGADPEIVTDDVSAAEWLNDETMYVGTTSDGHHIFQAF
jgi:hypothetical protein